MFEVVFCIVDMECVEGVIELLSLDVIKEV